MDSLIAALIAGPIGALIGGLVALRFVQRHERRKLIKARFELVAQAIREITLVYTASRFVRSDNAFAMDILRPLVGETEATSALMAAAELDDPDLARALKDAMAAHTSIRNDDDEGEREKAIAAALRKVDVAQSAYEKARTRLL